MGTYKCLERIYSSLLWATLLSAKLQSSTSIPARDSTMNILLPWVSISVKKSTQLNPMVRKYQLKYGIQQVKRDLERSRRTFIGEPMVLSFHLTSPTKRH